MLKGLVTYSLTPKTFIPDRHEFGHSQIKETA